MYVCMYVRGARGHWPVCMYVCLFLQDLCKSCERGGGMEKGGHVLKDTLAAACAFELGHLTLLSGVGDGEVVSKEVARRRGAREEEWTGGATTPTPSMLRLICIAAVLAAARPTLLFRPL